MCDVDCAITLSRYTESLITNFSSNTIVSCIPKLEYRSDIESVVELKGFQNYDLVIGRQKKYQNLKSVVKWWMSIPVEAKQGRTLIVAGKMSLTSRLRFAWATDVVLIRRWLSDGEFQSLIGRANRVICLYREASQSGIISAAQSNNTPVLASNVGGLMEQIESFGGGVVARLESPNDWLLKYDELNKVRPKSYNIEFATPQFISDIISAILQTERRVK
jgi:glycosyltransferase involved in cell wall biosynthesis